MNVNLNKKELTLLVEMLERFEDTIGNNVCNDFYFPDDWTPEERTQFVKEYHDVNGDPEEYEAGSEFIADFCVVYLLREKIKESLK